ncbi:kinase-like protein [Favolaschia claudopus]|uniref:non-specific serine/threonine protein kinase n=1 Tax=Favolaschia claudopus TaxID=2862362 RepID=A0AAW0BWQ3_9AGAR
MSRLLRQMPDTEQVNEYRPGGLHPVHLGDKLHGNRYEVVRKLGCGASGTVWLAQDHVSGGFAALKIMHANANLRELEIMRHLKKSECADIEEYVVRLLDEFEHTGPNGVHQCIVTEVLGPSLAGIEDNLENSFPDEVLSPEVVQSISLQIARGLRRLHDAGVVHGDFTKRNILLCAPAFARWKTVADIDEYMLEPQTEPLQFQESSDPVSPSPHRPSYTVYSTLSVAMTTACFIDPANVRVKICDFGESFFVDAPSGKVHIPPMYVSPEAAILRSVGPPSDVWALAVIVHDLVSSGWPLFATPWQRSNDAAVAGAVLRLGKLPDDLWSKWGARSTYFDEDANWTGEIEDRPFREDDASPIVSAHVTPERCGGDVTAFASVIRGMCDYDPARRTTSAEVVQVLETIWQSRQQDSDAAVLPAPAA